MQEALQYPSQPWIGKGGFTPPGWKKVLKKKEETIKMTKRNPPRNDYLIKLTILYRI